MILSVKRCALQRKKGMVIGMIEKNVRFSRLMGFYGELLSDRQKEVCSLYYDNDLSLAEISDLIGISRQGVRDCIKKSEANLKAVDEKLSLLDFFDERSKMLEDIIGQLRDVRDKSCENSTREELDKVIAVAERLLTREVSQ